MKTRKIPARMCVACGEMKEKKTLIRVVRSPDGAVAIDAGGKANGRGAYVCNKTDCVSLAKKRRILERNLKVEDCGAVIETLFTLCEDYER